MVAVRFDVDAAEDTVGERLVEGFGALEGGPACLERVEINAAGRLWGAECPDEDPSDEAEREQEIPSDSRLDFVESLRCRVWHLVVFSGKLLGVLASGVAVVVVSLGSSGETSGGQSYPCLGRENGQPMDRGCGTVRQRAYQDDIG